MYCTVLSVLYCTVSFCIIRNFALFFEFYFTVKILEFNDFYYTKLFLIPVLSQPQFIISSTLFLFLFLFLHPLSFLPRFLSLSLLIFLLLHLSLFFLPSLSLPIYPFFFIVSSFFLFNPPLSLHFFSFSLSYEM
jgi:hypothetical protein